MVEQIVTEVLTDIEEVVGDGVTIITEAGKGIEVTEDLAGIIITEILLVMEATEVEVIRVGGRIGGTSSTHKETTTRSGTATRISGVGMGMTAAVRTDFLRAETPRTREIMTGWRLETHKMRKLKSRDK